ncbi:MAG TPA: polysaccharide deacetylase family protein [Bacteroidales bacterium]|nr:polysaccharide deacetylase family protein [Bacteroidales bacterium]
MILMYHHIAQDAGFNTVSEKQFLEHLNFLVDNNYQIISLPDYISLLKTKELTARMVCLSFDDAYQSFPDVVLPILTKYKLTASVFVPTGFLGKTNEWDEPISTTQINVVSAAELEQLSKEAFITIGSHGVSHKPLSHLSVGEMTTEIFQSKSLLDTITKKKYQILFFSIRPIQAFRLPIHYTTQGSGL